MKYDKRTEPCDSSGLRKISRFMEGGRPTVKALPQFLCHTVHANHNHNHNNNHHHHHVRIMPEQKAQALPLDD